MKRQSLVRRIFALCIAVSLAALSGVAPAAANGSPVAVLPQDSGRLDGPFAGTMFFAELSQAYLISGDLTQNGPSSFTGSLRADVPSNPAIIPFLIFDIVGTRDADGALNGTARARAERGMPVDDFWRATFTGSWDGTILIMNFSAPAFQGPQSHFNYFPLSVEVTMALALGDCDLTLPAPGARTYHFPSGGGRKNFVVEPELENCNWSISVKDGDPWLQVSPTAGTSRQVVEVVVSPLPAGTRLCEGRTAVIVVRTLQATRQLVINQGEELSGFCYCPFLVAGSLGLKSGPETLRYARGFRDEVLARSDRGAEYTRLYYRFAEEVSAIFQANPVLLARAARLIDRHSADLRSLVDEGGVSIAETDLDEIDGLLADVAASGSPGLREAVARVRLDVRRPELTTGFGLHVRPAEASTAKRAPQDDLLSTTFGGMGALRPGEVVAVAAHTQEYLRASSAHGREVLELLARDPSLALRAPGALARMTSTVESVVRTGNATLDAGARAQLDAFLSGLGAEASPELRRAVDAFRRDLRSPRALEGLGVRSAPAATDAAARAAYERLPIAFVAGPSSGYSAHGLGYGLSVSSSDMALDLGRVSGRLRVRLIGANRAARSTARGALPGTRSYFVGDDPASWRTNLTASSEVAYAGVYPGVDLVYHGAGRSLEYDFRVAPGADPSRIRLRAEGADRTRLDERGDLVFETKGGPVRQRRPVAYQETGDGGRRAVDAAYEIAGNGEIALRLGSYDASLPLVVDPVVDYASYLGGDGFDASTQVVLDDAGNIYLCGSTSGGGFPASGGPQTSYGGGPTDAYVVKLDPTGSTVLFATYLGGAGEETGTGLALDPAGNVYVVGTTTSADFPTASALQTTRRGERDAFIARLDPTGSALTLSTYLGGTDDDAATGIGVSGKFVYVTGVTSSEDFPTSKKAYRKTPGGGTDAFVVKLKKGGSKIAYSTYFGGSGIDLSADVAVDAAGNAYIAGMTSSADLPVSSAAQLDFRGLFEGFVAKLNPKGTALVYSTFLGGTGVDGAVGIAVDGAGNAYVTGETNSTDFPVRSALQTTYGGGLLDGFVTKLGPTGSTLVYSTYLGGSDEDRAYRLAVDGAGRVHLTGLTASADFPVRDAIQSQHNGDGFDAFVTSIEPTGATLAMSTYLGGSGDDSGTAIAIDASGALLVVGETSSTDFPSVGANAGGVDAFIVRLGSGEVSRKDAKAPQRSQ